MELPKYWYIKITKKNYKYIFDFDFEFECNEDINILKESIDSKFQIEETLYVDYQGYPWYEETSLINHFKDKSKDCIKITYRDYLNSLSIKYNYNYLLLILNKYEIN